VIIDFGNGVITRQNDIRSRREVGELSEDFYLVRGDRRRNEGLRFGLLQAKRIAFAGLVALVIVDGDFEGLRRQL